MKINATLPADLQHTAVGWQVIERNLVARWLALDGALQQRQNGLAFAQSLQEWHFDIMQQARAEDTVRRQAHAVAALAKVLAER